MRPIAAFALVVSLSAVFEGCSGASSEATSPESSAKPETSATVSASAATGPTAPSASASAVAETPKPPAPEPGPDLKVVPLKVQLAKDAFVELKKDGTLWVNADKKSEQIGQVAKNQLQLTAMDLTYSVYKDGSLDLPVPPGFPPSPKVKFDEKDALIHEDGAKITLDDKGKLVVFAKDGKQAPPSKDAPVITGFKPEARRTALLLLLLPIALKK